MFNFFKGEVCKVFLAPFDVRLPRKGRTKDHQIYSVVQPDVFVVCDKTKVDEKGCCGAPDLVIEVLSPGSLRHDRVTKYKLYQQSGVREYWLVHPQEKNVVSFVLEENKKFGAVRNYVCGDTISSVAVTGFTIEVEEIFKENMEFPTNKL